MEEFNNLKNHLVKGKVLKALNLQFVKITNEEMFHNNFQLKIGENIDVNELTFNECSAGGIYFLPN